MRIIDFYRGKRFPAVTAAIAAMCLLISIPTFFKPSLFDSFAMMTQPKHLWQYATGIFEHIPLPAAWMVLVHLGMNFLALIPYGVMLERQFGGRTVFLLFLAEWIVTAVTFQCLNAGKEATTSGISTVCFAFCVPANVLLLRLWRREGRAYWKQPLSYFFAFEALGMLSLLRPSGSDTSLWLHASGLVVGTLATVMLRRQLRRIVPLV